MHINADGARPPLEKDLVQLILANDAAEFATREEGDQGDEHNEPHNQYALWTPAAYVGEALCQCLPLSIPTTTSSSA